MSEPAKDTIYIDIDDEITSIIEKVRDSKQKILALVLPKRATTLQSIVNMKLLKRTADESKKHIVLITSEASLLPLAGAVKLHVAKTLQSKPAIPPPPDMSKAEESIVDAEVDGDEPEIDDSKSVGELAGLPDEAEAPAKVAAAEETIDIDNSDEPEQDNKDDKKKSKSKIKIPNFNKFRLWLILGGVLLVGLIVLWYVMFRVMPKAAVTIQTNNQNASATVTLTADTATKALNQTGNIVPAEIKDIKETATQTANASGQKNIGNKASGTITATASCPKPISNISAGTGVSSAGLTFITTDVLKFHNTGQTGSDGNWICTGDVPITAQEGGTKYNLAANTTFAVAGYPGVSGSNDSAISGGTDQNVTVLSQSDIDGAKQKIASNTSQAQSDLSKALKADGEFVLPATLTSDPPSVSTSANAGDQVTSVTVTVVTTYHMLGVKQNDLQTLAATDVKNQIDTSKQQIFDYGLSQAVFNVTSKQSNNNQTLSMQTTVTAGANIDVASLKQQIAGKKQGDIKTLIGNLPSVQSVKVNYSPFWVTTTSHKTSRITINVLKSTTTSNGK